MKGIAIISVVLGHVCIGTHIERIVNQYHLATFFFVSGYFLKETQIDNIKNFAIRKFVHLYVPYMKYGILFLLLHNIFYGWHLENNLYDLHTALHEIRNFTIGMTSEEPLMGAMWFCPSLLMVSIFSAIAIWLSKQLHNVYLKAVILMSFPCLGYIFCLYGVKSPRCAWEYMQISGIFVIGYLFNKMHYRLYSKKVRRHVVSIVLCASLIMLYSNKIYANLQPQSIRNENLMAVLYVGSASAICMYYISNIIKKQRIVAKLLSIIGNYSFSIMALHLVCFKIVSLLHVMSYKEDVGMLSSFPVIGNVSISWKLFYIFVGVYVPIALTIIYRRCSKFIIRD